MRTTLDAGMGVRRVFPRVDKLGAWRSRSGVSVGVWGEAPQNLMTFLENNA